MALAAALLENLKFQLAPMLRVYATERFLAPALGGLVYSSWEENWYTRPPAVIRLNGVIQTTGFTVNYVTGEVTFAVSPGAAIVTAEFYFLPLTDTMLTSLITAGVSELAGYIGTTIDPLLDLDQRYETAVRDFAVIRAYFSILGSTAEYHRFQIDGAMVDKSMVTRHYLDIINALRKNLDGLLGAFPWNGLGDSTTVTTIGIGIT